MAVRVLFANTYLLRALPLPGGRWLYGAPLVEERAAELGAVLHDAYDVAALCEVFQPVDRDRLLAEAGVGADRARWVEGPRATPPLTFASSGLVTFASHRLVRSASTTFRTRGSRLVDSDAWAAKGVLLAEVDLGLPANLEVYSTHLFYGGDLLGSDRRHRSADLHRIRQAQLEELLAFVDATHRPENVALVVGDLNVDAEGRGPDSRATPEVGRWTATALHDAMDRAGFDDVWRTDGEGPGWTCDLLHSPLERFRVDPDEPDLCAEPAPAVQPGDHLVRIDLAHLQRPTPAHRLAVEVDRVRRRPFFRASDAPGRDRMATLSDHLGLHLELRAAPRS